MNRTVSDQDTSVYRGAHVLEFRWLSSINVCEGEKRLTALTSLTLAVPADQTNGPFREHRRALSSAIQ